MVEKLESEQTTANCLCEHLKQDIRDRVYLHLRGELPGTIKMHNNIMETKQKFEKQVTRDVLEVNEL